VERVAADLRQADRLSESERKTAHEQAFRLMRDAMSNAVGLMPVAEAAAVAICKLASAWEVTISLLTQGHYWDVADVYAGHTTYPRFPNVRYPIAEYPIGTERSWPARATSVATRRTRLSPSTHDSGPGPPWVNHGCAHHRAWCGTREVFLVRTNVMPDFTRDEQDLVSEFATLLGARLPALVAAYDQQGGAGSPQTQVMPSLTNRLDEHLR
jgi:hypothetical protein